MGVAVGVGVTQQGLQYTSVDHDRRIVAIEAHYLIDTHPHFFGRRIYKACPVFGSSKIQCHKKSRKTHV